MGTNTGGGFVLRSKIKKDLPMKNVIGIEDRVYPSLMETFSLILFDNINFDIKE